MKITLTLSGLILIVFLLSISACKKEENTEVQLTLSFNHNIDGETLEFDTIKYTNAYGNKYSVSTLKYFVSDVTLHNEDGTQINFDFIFYVDARDEMTMSYTSANKIPVGNYTSLSFTFGIDSAQNQTGIFPNPPQNLMEWPAAMGGGYHYMKLEGKFDSVNVVKNYQTHTGPTDGIDNSFEVNLTDSQFNCSCENVTIDINMNINNWYVNPNTIDLNTMTMIMGNEQKQLLLKANGSDVFTSSIEK